MEPPDVQPEYGYGSGPAYLTGLSSDSFYAGGFDGVMFVVRPDYTGWLAVRGQRMDGPGLVTFDNPTGPNKSAIPIGPPVGTTSVNGEDRPLYAAVAAPSGSNGVHWRDVYASTHVDSAGCYALQFDVIGGSYLVVITAANGQRRPG